jgi:hypothetical protein
MADNMATSNLAPMFGDYVTDYLGKGQALAGTDYQPYTGDMFAGPSNLQQQAFSGIGGLSMPQYYGQAGNMYGQATSAYSPLLDASDSGIVQGFMNPYTQQVTDIAKREAQRNFDTSQAGRDASAVKAGAFGGSRHGLVDAEAQRSLDRQLSDIQMQGGDAAYRQAMDALNSQRSANLQQQQGMAGTMLGAAGGLGSLGNSQFGAQQSMFNQQLGAGAQQQAFNQQPLDFGYQQWQQSQQFPYQQLQFQQGLLQGLPLSVNSQPQSNALLEGLMGAGGIYNLLFGGKP